MRPARRRVFVPAAFCCAIARTDANAGRATGVLRAYSAVAALPVRDEVRKRETERACAFGKRRADQKARTQFAKTRKNAADMRRRTPLCPRKRENALAFLGATCADARASSSGEKSASSESPMARAARMAGFHSPALRWGNYAWRAGGTHGDSGRQRPHARQGALFRDCLSMALPFVPGARRRAGALWSDSVTLTFAPWRAALRRFS